ncbi:hypothetical protein AAGS61_04400 [Lysinibacillus sp. KU-BSD001]|uniref:hypothetical protein n=1 Tax=Lysinibacillus sp. KU-BSD001 TaxID=3141328 RepID=UPI0036ED1D40
MIIFNRSVPEKLRKLQCVMRRVFSELEDELLKIEAGYAGERYVDLRWQDMNLHYSTLTRSVSMVFLIRLIPFLYVSSLC